MRARQVWADLAPHERRAIELAWESATLGSRGVGAVLVDGNGDAVAEGRNRVHDDDAPKGHLSGNAIAHAEIDLLGQLPPATYRDYTLYTTLQPCVLCAVAIAMSNVGSVHYLASDPLMIGVDRLPSSVPSLSRDWPSYAGPKNNAVVADFCAILNLCAFVREKPNGSLVKAYADTDPDLLNLALFLADDGWPDPQAVLAVQWDEIWPLLKLLRSA